MSMSAAAFKDGTLIAASQPVVAADSNTPIYLNINSSDYDKVKVYIFSGTTLIDSEELSF